MLSIEYRDSLEEELYEIIDNYVCWIIGNSYDEEMDAKLKKLPLAIKYTYLIYTYECEINNGGFDQFYFNSIGYEVFEIQKGLDFFGLNKNKALLDKSIELLKQKSENNLLTKSETSFFYKPQELQKNYIKSVEKKKFVK
mgnify:CR=1 FL=1